MAVKPKTKMTIEERAKQFMPFSALKGLDEALAKKEQQFTQRHELCDDESEIINGILSKLKICDKVCITYYDTGKNKSVSGEIEVLNKQMRFLEINKTQILFENLLSIEEI